MCKSHSEVTYKIAKICNHIKGQWDMHIIRIVYYPLRKADLNVLDFVVNRFFMKLFRTNNIGTVKECQSYFSFQLPTEMLKQRTERFDIKFKRLSASWL